MRILTLLGTRPEAIKLMPVIKELELREGIVSRVCSTGQHRELLDEQLALFGIVPDYNLNIMKSGQDLFDITERALDGIKKTLQNYNPDVVIVQGDTTTAFIGALSAFYMKITIAHVEAGLRTNDKLSPFPEEINRRLIDHMADILFPPTALAKENLISEGISDSKIVMSGNTAVDALMWMMDHQKIESTAIRQRLDECGILATDKPFILVTGHRRESFGKPFEDICSGIKRVAENNDVQIVYPVHLNPSVQKPVNDILGAISNISLIPPVDYELFVFLMSECSFILTDSGGIQEEAISLNKPVLIMRDKTERQEAIDAGGAKLVGTDSDVIFNESNRLLHDGAEYTRMSLANNPFGDGHAAARIVDAILRLT